MKRFFILLALTLSFSVFVNGCVQSFQDLIPLREKIIEKYQEHNIDLVLQNGNAIGVTFINSSFNDLEQGAKEQKAREIALFVKGNYESMDKIGMIWVAFTVHRNYIVLKYSNSLDTFIFRIEELD